ncbi:MAG TPA: FHA domain-containing protein [Phycisphaerae bacterium]|nr:FHA domain-containing protein [Phycisphaerae bacterium]
MATDGDPSRDVPARRPMGLGPVTSARAHLESTAGPEKGQTFRIAPGTTTLGRDPACEVALSESAISRQHCRIERREDEWILKNLSDNGTRLNRKLVDEAVLSDGDDIRIGAKTRLRFVVETAAASPTGRPQFRARTAEEETEEAAPEAEAEEPPSLFRRRKGLFIGLAIYLAVVVLLAAVLALRGTGGGGSVEIPVLALEPTIQPAPGASPLRVVKESQEGVWCEGDLNQPILVRKEDLDSGKAKRIPGIRQAIEGMANVYRQELPLNLSAAPKFRDKALDLYDRRNAEPRNLFGSVRCFQQALAYYGGRNFFPNQPTVDKIYLDALKELEAEIGREYNNAVVDEKTGDYKRAAQRYRHILDMIPEKENPIVQNVIRRLTALRDLEPER